MAAQLCNNWRCPSLISCRRHVTRAAPPTALAAVGRALPRPVDAKKGCCADYECDLPRTLLLGGELLRDLRAALRILNVATGGRAI